MFVLLFLSSFIIPHPLAPSPNGAFENIVDILFGEGRLKKRGLRPLLQDLSLTLKNIFMTD
jgi:hypothetical protein